MAFTLPSVATLNERIPMQADPYGIEINLFNGRSVHVWHIGKRSEMLAFPHGIEKRHASRFDAFIAALNHVAAALA
jgi:hypothetical protein